MHAALGDFPRPGVECSECIPEREPRANYVHTSFFPRSAPRRIYIRHALARNINERGEDGRYKAFIELVSVMELKRANANA